MNLYKLPYLPKIRSIYDPIIKSMGAQEFVQLVTTRPHLIKRSKFVPAAIGSRGLGRFIVEFENDYLYE